MVGSKTTEHHHQMDVDDDDDAVEPSSKGVPCSICLDSVSDNGDRSRAKLHCGHEFHLDCIGSEFNMKGAMQCPNCQKIETGQWLCANGSSCSLPELSMEDWIPDEHFYDLSYSEMPFRVHWCPFGELAQVGSYFEEVLPPSTTYHDLWGNSAIFTEYTGASSMNIHVTYVGPILPTTNRSSNNVDDPHLNHHWNGLSGYNEIFTRHALPGINSQYHSWGRHSPRFSISSSHMSGAEPASIPHATLRSSHGESDAATMSRSFHHPLVFDHGAGSSFVFSVVPRRPGSGVLTHERIQASHAFHHHTPSSDSLGLPTLVIPGIRRFDGPTSLPVVVLAPLQHDQNDGFYFFAPSSVNQNVHEADNLLSYFHVWDRERLSRFPFVSRDSSWGHQNAIGSDLSNRSGSFWHRHSS